MALSRFSFCTGWEHGVLNNAAAGICSCSVHTNISVQTTTKRTGSYALKIAHSASADFWSHGLDTIAEYLGCVYHRVSAVPTVDVAVCYYQQSSGGKREGGIGIRSNGKYATFVKVNANAIMWGADGPSVTAGEFVRLNFRYLKSAPTHTVQGYVGPTALGDATDPNEGAGTSSLGSVVFGNKSGVTGFTDTYDEYFDDAAFAGANLSGSPTWPFPLLGVEILTPNAEGTHNTAANFSDDVGASPPGTPQTRLDEIPQTGVTDWIRQDTLSTTSYIELGMSNMTQAVTGVLGVYGVVSIISDDSSATAFNASAHVVNGADDQSLFAGSQSAAVQEWHGLSVPAVGQTDPVWDSTQVNAALMRLGYSGDVTPKPRFETAFLEVAGYFTPVPTSLSAGAGTIIIAGGPAVLKLPWRPLDRNRDLRLGRTMRIEDSSDPGRHR